MSTDVKSEERLSVSLTSASLDLCDVPYLCFVASSGSEMVVMGDALRPLLGNKECGLSRTTLAEIEGLLGVSVRSSIDSVISSGTKTCLNELTFADLSGGMRKASLHLVPVRGPESENTWCAGLLVDQTDTWRLSQKLNLVQSELSIVSQVSSHLGATMEAEDILKIILIAVTAREGLGFNRAFIFMFDERSGDLIGDHAIGPIDADEAGHIWGTIPDEGMDLRSIISSYLNSVNLADRETDRRVREVRLQVDDSTLPISDSIASRCPIHLSDRRYLTHLVDKTRGLIGHSNVAIAPLSSRKRAIGVIIADNLITGRRISETDLDQLHMFASQAATALERAILYENLQSYAEKLEHLNRELEGSQREIIRMERLSLMGEITNRIAHELRNPLTVIGGFAGLLLKTDGLSDVAMDRAETIQSESRRIERHLDVLLDFSRSYSQETDSVDLNKLVEDVARMVQPAFIKLDISIATEASESQVMIRTHRDLLLFGLYNVICIAGEFSSTGTKWLIRSREHGRTKMIEAIVREGAVSLDTAVRLMGRVSNGHSSAADLRLSLANEAISYNGGNLGCDLRGSEPRIYITFDS